MGIYGKIIDIQKLGGAWDHVRKNKPAAGVDNVTYEDFENQRKEELKQLNLELVEHRYESLPIKLVDLYKGEKVRSIALFCMRDKVVQQSLAQELGKIYEPLFSECSYAYRPGQSALQALEKIEAKISRGEQLWVLKMDIDSYFDNINHAILLNKMRQKIQEDDVVDLVKGILRTKVLDEKTGELSEKKKGIFQGASCAPIMSNIYLMDYDIAMEKQSGFYIRYSDDILVLETEEAKAQELFEFTERVMEKNGLTIKKNKTQLHRLTEKNGFEYLGYAFSSKGKSIPEKAKSSLTTKLETMWLTSGLKLADKIKKGREIVGGWEQYFREKRTIGNILEYVIVLSMARNKGKDASEHLEKQRFQYTNYYRDVLGYMVEYWMKRDRTDNVIREYEQFFRVPEQKESADIEKSLEAELIAYYKQLSVQPNEELYDDIIQLYTDMGCFRKASYFWEKKSAYNQAQSHPLPITVSSDDSFGSHSVDVDVSEYYSLFVGREDTYVTEILTDSNRRCSEQVLRPLTEAEVRHHLDGEKILGTYIQRPNGTVHFLVLDVDISKKQLLQHPYGSAEFVGFKQKAAEYASELLRTLSRMGITGYIEDTGFRGYHVWIFFMEWIPVRYANQLAECIIKETIDMCDDITMEMFPNTARIRPGKCGQSIKLPLGVHIRTGKQSKFLDDQMQPLQNEREYLASISKTSLNAVRKVLGTYLAEQPEYQDIKEVDTNLDNFGNISDSIRIVLEHCTLMRYLCQKAVKTGYLSHFERLSVLYVFGHMGEDGKDFVHAVMSFTLNYKYNVTQKFIMKMPEKPVSCAKLREQYKLITAEYGCSCSFRQTKNCYPSPVLHALKNSGDMESEITIPVSRTVSKAKEEQVYEEINIHKQTQKLAQKIVDMKKQKHGLDKSIRKIEIELQKIFDNAGIDCLEIEMGILVRRKKEDSYEWLIEI